MPLSDFDRMGWSNLEKFEGSTIHKLLDAYQRIVVQPCLAVEVGQPDEKMSHLQPSPPPPDSWPTKIELHVGYLQDTPTYKHIVKVQMCFKDFVQSKDPPKYSLSFHMEPLGGIDVLDEFGFPMFYPVIVTVLFAFIVFVSIFLLQQYGKANTVVIPQPQLRFMLYFKQTAFPALFGFCIQYTSIMMVVGTLYLLFHDSTLYLTQSFKIDRDSSLLDTAQTKREANFKRFGLFFVITGSYVIMTGGFALIPVPKKEKTGIFSKSVWYRTHFFFCKSVFCITQSLLILFTRTPIYKQQVFLCTIIISGVQIVIMRFITKMLPDTLMLTSFQMVKAIVSKTCSLGVATFMQFMVTYTSQLMSAIATRALGPIAKRAQAHVKEKIDGARRFRRVKLALLGAISPVKAEQYERSLRSGGLKDRKAYKPAEIIQKELAVMDLYKNAIQFVAAMFSPAFTVFIFMFSAELGIVTSFGQKDLVFYVIFGFVMLLFQFLYDIFVQNYVEMRYGWKLNAYLQRASKIFRDRPKAWILKCPESVESKDINRNWRSIDHMCFSSQFYFVAAYLTFGCLLTVYGLMVSLNGTGYKIFKDDALPFLVVYVFTLCHAAEIFVTKCAIQWRLWFRTGKEEAAEAKEVQRQREQRNKRGKSDILPKKGVVKKSEMKTSVQNEALTMLVDDSVLKTFRGAVEEVYRLPVGLTPTELAIRINDQSETIKQALTERQQLYDEGRNVTNSMSASKSKSSSNKVVADEKVHKGKMEGKKSSQLPHAKRGSVKWGNMHHASAEVENLTEKEGGISGPHIEKDFATRSTSKWVPIEFYGAHYIPGFNRK